MDNLIRKFEQLGIDTSLFVFGKGCNKSKGAKGRKSRYVMKSTKVSDKTIFAIQYCEDIKQYIAWKTPRTPRRSCFSIIAENVPLVDENEVLSANKGKEYIWKELEKVYTFSESGIETFVKEVLMKL